MFFPVLTVTQPASSYDLIDLATVHDELSIPTSDTSNDSFLGRAISQVSIAIANYCSRVFVPEGVTERFDVRRDFFGTPIRQFSPSLQCSRWPVISVNSVTQYPPNQTSILLVQDTDFRLDARRGLLNRLNIYTGLERNWEELPLTVNYIAGFGALTTETIVASGTPPQVTVSQAAAYSFTQSVSYTGGATLSAVASNPAAGQYAVSNGVYTFNSADAGKSVTISYAYNQIPDDLVDVCLRLITARFRSKGRDPALVQSDQPGVGSMRYWVGGTPHQNGPFPPDISSMLDSNYRVPVVG